MTNTPTVPAFEDEQQRLAPFLALLREGLESATGKARSFFPAGQTIDPELAGHLTRFWACQWLTERQHAVETLEREARTAWNQRYLRRRADSRVERGSEPPPCPWRVLPKTRLPQPAT